MDRFSSFLAAKLPFYYGYFIVLVAVLAQICSSPGQTFAIAAFTPYLQESLGLSSSKLAAAYMLGTLLAAIPLLLIGPASDRFGLRWTTVVVAVGLAAACLLASRATDFTSILIAFMLLRFLGQGALSLLSGNMVSMWFQLRLGTVNSIMSVGGAAAFALVPLALIETIQIYGWRATYVGMGGFVLLSLVPLLILTLRNRPEDLGQLLDGLSLADHAARGGASVINRSALGRVSTEREVTLVEAISDRTFWILATDLLLWAMIGTGIVFYALPIFAQYGIPPEESKLLFTTFSACMLLAQIVGGVLADCYPMHRLLACGFALLTLGASVIPLTNTLFHVHLFAALFGTGQGLAISVNSTMWVRYYGRKHLGKIRGAVWCSTVAGSGCGPVILGLTSDHFGSFSPGLWLFVALLLPLAPLSWLATGPPAGESETEHGPDARDRASQAEPDDLENSAGLMGQPASLPGVRQDAPHTLTDAAQVDKLGKTTACSATSRP